VDFLHDQLVDQQLEDFICPEAEYGINIMCTFIITAKVLLLWTASLGSNSGAGIKIRIGMLVFWLNAGFVSQRKSGSLLGKVLYL
jgi:hypothetical protein